MNAIVFDNAGTIIKRVSALKNMHTNQMIYDSNTIGLVNNIPHSLILVFQKPVVDLIKYECRIVDYLKDNYDDFEISYSNELFTKNDVIDALYYDNTFMKEIFYTYFDLIDNYKIDICSGSALIVNMDKKRIEYVYTAGGLFFKGISSVFKKLKKLSFLIYIASGDNIKSLEEVGACLNVPSTNIYGTCNSSCKQNVVKILQNQNHHVFMVGNNTNDELAIKQADVGILTIQQKEQLPDSLYKSADYIIKDINDVLKIIKKEIEF